MSKSIKFKNNNYLDSSSIVHNKKSLKNILDEKEVYTNEEQKIGIWTDGKPIYRKVYTGTCSSETTQQIDSANNISQLINAKGMFVNDADKINTPIGSYYVDNSRIWRNANGIQLSKGPTFSTDYFSFIVIIEYTKTTD